jgi:hypothetical protein
LFSLIPSMAIVLDDRDAAERPFTQVQQTVAARELQGRQGARRRDEERHPQYFVRERGSA